MDRAFGEMGRASAPFGRAAQIIDIVSAAQEGLTLKMISDAAGLPSSTTYRLVKSLLAIGYLALSDQQKTYHLGRRLFRVMHAAFGARNIQTLAEPILGRMARQFAQVFYVNQLVAEKVRLVAFVMPDVVERALVVPGEYLPMHATAAGKVIFAFQESVLVEKQLAKPLPQYLPNTITDPEAVREELESVRQQGYAVTHSEFEMGVIAIAVPVELPDAGVVFSIGVAGLEAQIFDRRPLKAYVDAMRSASKELRSALAGVRSENGKDKRPR